jgi:hypothetical protein
MRRSNSSGDRYWVVDDDGVDAKRLESRNGARSLANEHHGPFVLN